MCCAIGYFYFLSQIISILLIFLLLFVFKDPNWRLVAPSFLITGIRGLGISGSNGRRRKMNRQVRRQGFHFLDNADRKLFIQ